MLVRVISIFILVLACLDGICQSSKAAWPSVTRETKPWSRWWWHGSAVTKEGISAELEAFKKAGLGGLEITPIYGVQGFEKQFKNYLTPEWLELLAHTLKEAERLDIGIDMATGTGWPFGGPWISEADACKNVEHKTFQLRAGEKLSEKIVFVQQPYLRAVGGQVYEVRDSAMAGEHVKVIANESVSQQRNEIKIEQLVQPVEANKNLQALALDQVKFEKALPLQTLMAYSHDGKTIELTDKVDKDGNLNWIAPDGNWTLYAVFMGWHGKMVERAGPGGEGNVIDHFSSQALRNYLSKFDTSMEKFPIESLRAFFNDSYEVDDARGVADWTPLLLQEFKSRRGYDLKAYLPALFGKDTDEKNRRVLCDYRETVSELILENFTLLWKTWAHRKNAIIRNQAHGSPANILDLYATVDIPEIEGIEPLRIKMASSAGNVTGKRLISSESATWLNEHFESNLSDIKIAVDRFLLHGVNHIFYHGTSYSPLDEPWPGWLFYAAVHLNPRNPLWVHFPALNKYIERAQSLLQNSKPDNDILLYYPIYDRFSTPGEEMIEHFDGVGVQFHNTFFKQSAEMMLAKGFTYDYISDKQINKIKLVGSNLITEGGAQYKTVVLPHCQFIPLTTFNKLLSLADAGATIIFAGGPPANISGFSNAEANRRLYLELLNKLRATGGPEVKEIKYGKGRVLSGNDAEKLLAFAAIRKEEMTTKQLQFLRKRTQDNTVLYFISNGDKKFSDTVRLQAAGQSVVFYNPMTGDHGFGTSTLVNGKIQTHLSMQPYETLFLEVRPEKSTSYSYHQSFTLAEPSILDKGWTLEFTSGGPALPPRATLDQLNFWTALNGSEAHKTFSGCATYSVNFDRPNVKTKHWLLDLGAVEESAEVFINGKTIGTLIGPAYQITVDNSLLKDHNKLEVKVCNLMANRIAHLDRQNIAWKKFYNINFPSRKPENRKNNLFSAANWKPHESGLKGPVRLVPIQPAGEK